MSRLKLTPYLDSFDIDCMWVRRFSFRHSDQPNDVDCTLYLRVLHGTFVVNEKYIYEKYEYIIEKHEYTIRADKYCKYRAPHYCEIHISLLA